MNNIKRMWVQNDLNSNYTNTQIEGSASSSTPSGTNFFVEISDDKKNSKKKGMSVKIFFGYVKRKFGILGDRRFEKRIKKLEKLAIETENIGQIALSENFMKKAIKEARECELYASGFRIFIEKKLIEKFKEKTCKPIYETKLKNFSKPIPNSCQKEIKKCLDLKLFDEIIIMHTNQEDKELTEEEKKDPIAFGIIAESDRYYFITDWEDEFCNLTLDDIIDKLDLEEDEIKLKKNPELNFNDKEDEK